MFLLQSPLSRKKIFIFVLRVDKTRRGVMGVVRKSEIVMQDQACKSVIFNIFHSCSYWPVKYSPTSSEDTKNIFNASPFPWMSIVIDSLLFTCIFFGRAASTISLTERSHLQAETTVKSVRHSRIVYSLVENSNDLLQTFYPFLSLQKCHCCCWNHVVPDQIRRGNSLRHTGPLLGQYWRTLCTYSKVFHLISDILPWYACDQCTQ